MMGRLLAALTALLVVAFASGAALAAPPQDVVMLSSWTPEVVDGSVGGGDQTVTVVNIGSETSARFAYRLVPAPCACDLTDVTIDGGWLSVSITLGYDLPTASALGASTASYVRSATSSNPWRAITRFAQGAHTAI